MFFYGRTEWASHDARTVVVSVSHDECVRGVVEPRTIDGARTINYAITFEVAATRTCVNIIENSKPQRQRRRCRSCARLSALWSLFKYYYYYCAREAA